MKRRHSSREELLTEPEVLSDWAVQAGLLDVAVDVSDDDLLNERASGPQLTPRLLRTGAVRREGTTSQLLASLAADLLDLLAGTDIENVKRCAGPDCTRLYLDASRAKSRQWCGMGTCGNRAKVQAFRARQRAGTNRLR